MVLRALVRCRVPRSAALYISSRSIVTRSVKVCQRDCQKRSYSNVTQNFVTRIINGVKNNFTGYTRVLIVVMGIMTVIVIVAEQSIAQNMIILNVLPQKPGHKVFSYPSSLFENIKTGKQFLQAKTILTNIHGPNGCGKTEFLRQYCEFFLQEGPHWYFKLHKLSNRRNCQVFVIDARNSQTLGHSLTALNNRLKQKKGSDGASENHKLIEGIGNGLTKQSRWLLIFENASPDLQLLDLLSGYESWGDGQIIITSEKPLKSCHTVSFNSLIPRSIAENVFFSIAPSDQIFDSKRLQNMFGCDLRSVVAAANCLKIEADNGIDFGFEKLCEVLSESNKPSEDVIKLFCSLLALEQPKLLIALDFIGKLPPNIPVPYKYIKHHMDTNMYDSFLESIPGFLQYRLTKFSKKAPTIPEEESPLKPHIEIDPDSLSFFKKQRHKACTSLGLDPSRAIMEQLREIYEMVSGGKPMELPDDPELILLKQFCLLKYDQEYGGHVPVFNIDEDVHNVIKCLHTEFTVPLIEACLVLEQDIRYHRTWMSKMWSFRQSEQTLKYRSDILGKSKVHLDPKNPTTDVLFPKIPAIYDSALVYKATPISHANLAEYNDLHYKQVLKSIMSFVDVTVPNTVKGTIESIILHGHLSALSDHLPTMFSDLAETCSLHLKSELGGKNMEQEFKSYLSKVQVSDLKGPSHASALHRYAVWLHNNSRDSEAKILLEEALKFADSLSLNRTMAQVRCELDEHAAAEKYLEKAVNSVRPGDQEILGPLLTDLGQIMLLQGKTTAGIKILQGAIEGYKNQLGTENPDYARALNVVSIGHLMLGDALRANRARNEASSVLAKLKKNNVIVDE